MIVAVLCENFVVGFVPDSPFKRKKEKKCILVCLGVVCAVTFRHFESSRRRYLCCHELVGLLRTD